MKNLKIPLSGRKLKAAGPHVTFSPSFLETENPFACNICAVLLQKMSEQVSLCIYLPCWRRLTLSASEQRFPETIK